MKKLISIVATVGLLSSVASAEVLKNFKYDGTVEINAYSVNNADFDKNQDDNDNLTQTRVILNMGFDLTDDVRAELTAIKNNRYWGTKSESIDGEGILDNLYFEQAYLHIKGALGIDHKFGRQFYGNPGDLVVYFGPKYWPYEGMNVEAIDAWVGNYKYNNFDFTAILGKEFLGTIGVPNDDIDLKGIDVKAKITEVNLNAYYYEEVDRRTTNQPSYLGLAGLRAKGEIYGIKLGGEYNRNLGKYKSTADWIKYKGYAYKLNAGYELDLMGKISFGGEHLFTSANKTSTTKKYETFTAINSDWRPTIILGGYLLNDWNALIDFGNRIYGITGSWTPKMLNKLNLEAKYYDFSTVRIANNLSDKHVASEFNLVATWNHSENVSVKGYYAALKPEKKNITPNDTMTMMGAAVSVKF